MVGRVKVVSGYKKTTATELVPFLGGENREEKVRRCDKKGFLKGHKGHPRKSGLRQEKKDLA